MEYEHCKNCRFYKSYYHGEGSSWGTISERCFWTLKEPKDVKETECNKKLKGE